MVRLVIENLSKSFKDVEALYRVSLSIESGEVFSIVGPSGSGKTTLLRCVAGLEIPDHGRIIVGDKTIFDSDKGVNIPPEKRDMGFVPQTWALWPHMRVWDNIAFGLKIKRFQENEIRRRIKQVSEVLGISDLLDRWPWQLSGGQQQRVALARALVLEPKVILLDEPLSNLDAALREEARLWLRDLMKRLKITSLYVTHDLSEALAISDRLAVIINGEIKKVGSPREIYSNMDNPDVASLFRFNISRGEVVDKVNNQVTVRLGSGSVICREGGSGGIDVGSSVYVIFSPDRVRFGSGSIEGVIRSSIYLGSVYEYLIDIGADKPIKARSQTYIDGSRVRLYIEECIASPI